eukprot:1158374-Pelagomonas_calceolata.AAC.4
MHKRAAQNPCSSKLHEHEGRHSTPSATQTTVGVQQLWGHTGTAQQPCASEQPVDPSKMRTPFLRLEPGPTPASLLLQLRLPLVLCGSLLRRLRGFAATWPPRCCCSTLMTGCPALRVCADWEAPMTDCWDLDGIPARPTSWASAEPPRWTCNPIGAGAEASPRPHTLLCSERVCLLCSEWVCLLCSERVGVLVAEAVGQRAPAGLHHQQRKCQRHQHQQQGRVQDTHHKVDPPSRAAYERPL